MALIKQTTLSTGVTGEYWRITQVQAIYPDQAIVTVALYLDEEARKSKKSYLLLESYTLNLDGEATREKMYQGLKDMTVETMVDESMTTIPGFFSDAIDG